MKNAIKQKTKYSGVEWLGYVPESWEVRKVSRIFQCIGSGTTPNTSNRDYYDNGEIRWLNTGDLNDDYLADCEKRITELAILENPTLRTYPTNSLVIALYGATIGKLGILTFDTTVNQACCVMSDTKLADIKFIYYWFLVNKENLIQMSYGGGQPNISQDIIRSLKIPLPTLTTQKVISEYLDINVNQIKKFIDDKKKLVSLLQEQKRTIIYYSVTNGVDNKSETKVSGIDWLGDIPKDWKVLKLKHGVKLNAHKSVDHIDKNIALENIEGWTGKLIETDGTFEGEGNLFKKDDVLFGKLRPYLGKVYLSEYSGRCVNEILVFTPNINILNSEYLYYICSSSEFIKTVDSSTYGSKMPRAEWDFIGRMKVPIPDIETQKEIVTHIKKSTQKIDQAIHTVQQEIELIEEYKKSLIYQAVTGKIETLLTNK